MEGRSGSPRLVPAVTAAVADASTDLDGSLSLYAQAVGSLAPTYKHTGGPSLFCRSVEEWPPSAHRAPLVNLQRRAHLNYPFPAPSGQPAAQEPMSGGHVLADPGQRPLVGSDDAEGEE
jgi:hypothetical protein